MNDKRRKSGDGVGLDAMRADDDVMKELEELWAHQNERIEAILSRPESMPKGINPHAGVSQRRVDRGKLLVLSAVSVIAGVYSLVAFGGEGNGIVRVWGCVLAAVNAAIAAYGIAQWRALARPLDRIHIAPDSTRLRGRLGAWVKELGGMVGGFVPTTNQLATCCGTVAAIMVLTVHTTAYCQALTLKNNVMLVEAIDNLNIVIAKI